MRATESLARSQGYEMRRREFVEMVGVAIAAESLAGCLTRTSRAAPTPAALGREPMDAGTFHAARRYVDTRFGRIAMVERGAGDAALFLHGFPLNSFQWRGALDRLSAHRRCIAPDFMALGYTQIADNQSVAPDAQVAMLVALLDALRIPVVDLVANDSGGAVAQLLVTRHGERVRSLLLTNCDAETDSPPPALLPVIAMAREGTFADRWLAPWVADKTLARSPDGLGGQTYTHPTNPSDEAIDYYLTPLVASPRRKAQVHAYALALERNPLAGIAPALRRSRVPTRIVWGTGDTIFSPGSPDYLDRTLGNSRGIRRVPGAKLFFPEEYPDIIAEEARRLWAVE